MVEKAIKASFKSVTSGEKSAVKKLSKDSDKPATMQARIYLF